MESFFGLEKTRRPLSPNTGARNPRSFLVSPRDGRTWCTSHGTRACATGVRIAGGGWPKRVVFTPATTTLCAGTRQNTLGLDRVVNGAVHTHAACDDDINYRSVVAGAFTGRRTACNGYSKGFGCRDWFGGGEGTEVGCFAVRGQR